MINIYSYEIEEFLRIKENIISTNEYFNILDTSPQINHVKYDNGSYEINTNDNYHFKVKIKTRLKS